jgi:acetyl esterase/lipase
VTQRRIGFRSSPAAGSLSSMPALRDNSGMPLLPHQRIDESQLLKTNSLIIAAVAILGVLWETSVRADEPAPMRAHAIVPLWPKDRMRGRAAAGPEREMASRGDNVIRLTDVNEPTLAVFKAPATDKPTPAVIVCPGGGYGILAYNKEGTEVAAWLNTIGITGIVLKYRVPGNQDGAFQDIQRAIRLVRQNAADWNIAPQHVGVMGFSAGGHLSARLSTNHGQPTYSPLDAADEKPLRPDFAILVYPAYLAQGSGKLSDGLPVNDKTPPTFIVHTEDDKSFITGSKRYHDALKAAQVTNEFFLCATGGHGYGLRSNKEVGEWPKKCQAWLMQTGIR